MRESGGPACGACIVDTPAAFWHSRRHTLHTVGVELLSAARGDARRDPHTDIGLVWQRNLVSNL